MKKLILLITLVLTVMSFTTIIAQPANDNFASAIEVTHADDWCSADAAYTTVDATPDGNAGSCWNTNPNYNVWFYFVATSTEVTVTS